MILCCLNWSNQYSSSGWNCQPWPSRSQNWMFVYFIIILSRSQQFPTSSSQNQVELGEWATGHFMHCRRFHDNLILMAPHKTVVTLVLTLELQQYWAKPSTSDLAVKMGGSSWDTRHPSAMDLQLTIARLSSQSQLVCVRAIIPIESIKTPSMENVSTGVHEKIMNNI